MTYERRGIFRLAGMALLVMTTPACAQDNLDRGKTAQQLFASDCAICHKSPKGLAKGGGLFGLQGFLREHYTASRETANLLARYLEAAGEAPAPAQKRQPRRTSKPSDTKPADTKPAESKPAESKPADAKPSDTKPADETPVESKPPSESKSEPTVEPKAATEPKPESKPDTEIKSGISVTPAPADKPKSE